MNLECLPIGTSDFKELVENKRYYVDKSLFINDIVNSSSNVPADLAKH